MRCTIGWSSVMNLKPKLVSSSEMTLIRATTRSTCAKGTSPGASRPWTVRSRIAACRRNGMVWYVPISTRPPVAFSIALTARLRTLPWKESVVMYQAALPRKRTDRRKRSRKYFHHLRRAGLGADSVTAPGLRVPWEDWRQWRYGSCCPRADFAARKRTADSLFLGSESRGFFLRLAPRAHPGRRHDATAAGVCRDNRTRCWWGRSGL